MKSGRAHTRFGERERFMLALILPAVLILVAFQVIPILIGANASFRHYPLFHPQKTWVGLANYVRVLTDPLFYGKVLPNTFMFMGCSVTGGYVYRGEKTPSLRGYYIYGDYCSGNIWALGYHDGTVILDILLVESGLNITSFGEDLPGNLYMLSREGGIYTLAQTE